MNQKLRFLMLALLCAMLNVAWGDQVTISPTQALNEGGVSPITVTCAQGDGTSSPAISSSQLRLYQAASGKTTGNTITFSSENTITSIVFTFANNMTADNGAFSEGSYNSSNSTWTGSTNSVTLTVTGTTSGKRIYITQMVVTYANDQPASDKYYVAGSWTNPTWGDGKIQMTKSSDGKYILSNQMLPKETSFKIIKVPSNGTSSIWCGGDANGANYWVTVDNHTDIPLIVDGGKDFYLEKPGTWTFIVDPTGDTPKLTVEGNWPKWEYYLVGDFNEWKTTSIDSYKFSQVGETSNFTLNKPIKFGEKFKIYGIRDSEEKWFGAVSNGDFWVNAEHVDTDLSLTTENGGENFYMNLSNKKDYWTLNFNPTNKKLVLSNYLSDIAALPFEFDGGRGDIEGTPGLTTNGLGTDYKNSPKLKFDTANNMVVLHFDERPGILSYDIKGNSFSGGTFQVLTSNDGENWNALKEYTELDGSLLSEEFDNLGENVRYIKWLYKTKSSGNVALGNIKLEKYEAPQQYTLTITPNDHAEIFVFYNDDNNTAIENGDQVLSGSEVLVSVAASEGYHIQSVTVTDGEEQTVPLTEVEGEEGAAWTFIMPKSNVTVACTAIEEGSEKWVLTSLADLTEDDIFVIVGNNGTNYAMSNDKGTSDAPTAVEVIVADDNLIKTANTDLVTDNIKWNISGNATDGYTFYPNGDKENWLYANASNNGLRVGTNADKAFIINNNYLFNTAKERFLGIYDSQDWRCYTSINSNITGQTFAFYKLVKPGFTFSIKSEATDGETCYATISELGDGCFKVVGDVEVRTVNVINGKLNYPVTFYEGDVISGDGAYLVVGAAGSYTFPAVTGTQPLPDNALKSSGKSGVSKSEMETINGSNNKFYKLAKRNGKIGFYWGADKGAAFDYNTPRQAYLVVPLPETGEGNLASAYFFDGDATGIYSVNAEVEGTDAESVYSLSGIRMDGKQLPKGIYIVNGKKKVIK